MKFEYPSDNQHFSPLNHSISALLLETNEHDKCSHNMIIQGRQVCTSTIPAEMIASDLNRFNNYIRSVSMFITLDLKLFRLGQIHDKGPRPLK